MTNSILPAELQVAPASHQFPLGVIQLFMSFLLSAASSQRCASAIFKLLAETCRLELPAPCPNAGRLWLLKHELEAHPRWAQFVSQSNQTRLRVTQTALAFLNPPGLKAKARYMNLDLLVDWRQKALRYLDEPRDFPNQLVDRAKLTEKLGWLPDYREDVARWAALLKLAAQGEDYVRQEGYHRGAQAQLRARLPRTKNCQARRRMRARLLRFVGQQSRSARAEERLIGSSEVLESLIGKYKRLQGNHSKGGMTATLLAIGAIVLDKTATTIDKALAATKTKDVYAWVKTKLGITIQAQRKLAFEGTKPAHKPGTPE